LAAAESFEFIKYTVKGEEKHAAQNINFNAVCKCMRINTRVLEQYIVGYSHVSIHCIVNSNLGRPVTPEGASLFISKSMPNLSISNVPIS